MSQTSQLLGEVFGISGCKISGSLVVSNMNFIFIHGRILPIDEIIFFKMVKNNQPVRVCRNFIRVAEY